MSGRLNGKVCIITGTGGAIGAASARAFARAGARVIGCDTNAEGAQHTLDTVLAAGGDMISVHPCDLLDRERCHAVVAAAIGRFGQLDVLFNNAGRLHHGWMSDSADDFWFRTIDEELHIVFLLCRAAWSELCKSGGSIINMASTAGHTTYRKLPGIAHSAAKGAIIGMTRHLAMEGRTHNVRANSISPGVIGSPAVLEQAKNPDWDAAFRGRMMRGRYGTPDEVAAVAVFLASDESSFVNAADIVVDDGVTAWG